MISSRFLTEHGPSLGLNPTTLRLPPEPKPRVRYSTNQATWAPAFFIIFK